MNTFFFTLGRRWVTGLLFLSLGCSWLTTAQAGQVFDRVKITNTLRVCIWPDYYGVSFRNPNNGVLSGIDIDLAREFARELQLKVEYVDSSFATLIEDVQKGSCDVAMFAVGVLPQRAQFLRFTQPYMQSGIFAITTKGNRVVKEWQDIDRPGVVVGVQAGTFMEPVMRSALRNAQLEVIRAPATRERELVAGRIDVFMTDYPYSRRLLDNADWARLITPPEPVHPLPYAYAVKPGDDQWFAAIDGFVRRIKMDGRLNEAAKRHGLSLIVGRP